MRCPSLRPRILLLAGLVTAGARPGPSGAAGIDERSDVVQVVVKSVWRSPDPLDINVVFLRDPKTERLLPIWVGRFEADAIQMKLSGQTFPRPLTHDLIKSLIQAAGARVDYVLIDALRSTDGRDNGTYFAKIALTPKGREKVEVDSRTSDAIALSLRAGAPVYVASAIMKGNSISSEEELSARRRLEPAPEGSQKEQDSPVKGFY